MTKAAILVAACIALLAASAPATAAEATCPDTFSVLHDDRVGPLALPAGNYTITLLDSDRISCASASDLFRQFLEDYDGRLRRPWVVDASRSSFTSGVGGTTGFRVAPASTPTGGGGGGRYPAGGPSCAGYFAVEHDDHIGRFAVPAGEYRITLLAAGRLSCSRAAALFADFLQDFNGRLPAPWLLDRSTGTFIRSHHVGFRVKEAIGPPRSPARAGTHPSDGDRCRGTFRVQHNDRIGRLRLPAGPYIITPLRGGGLSCSEAANRFRNFLDLPAGNLPRPWVLDPTEGTFQRGRGGRTGFRVKPGR